MKKNKIDFQQTTRIELKKEAIKKPGSIGFKALFMLFLFPVFFISCDEFDSRKTDSKTSTNSEEVKSLTGIMVKTFESENGWGYDVFRNGKRYIHQPSKPAVGGNNGFDTELQARKFGELVIHKIENGIVPPSVTTVEVDSIIHQYK